MDGGIKVVHQLRADGGSTQDKPHGGAGFIGIDLNNRQEIPCLHINRPGQPIQCGLDSFQDVANLRSGPTRLITFTALSGIGLHELVA